MIHLFEYNFLILNFNRTSLYRAIELDNIDIVKLLLAQPKIDVNSGIKEISVSYYDDKKDVMLNKSPLYLAVENENIGMVKILIEQSKVNVNFVSTFYEKTKIQKTAYQLASERQNDEICQLLSSVNGSKVYQLVNGMCQLI